MLPSRQTVGHIVLFISDFITFFALLLFTVFVRTLFVRVIPGFPPLAHNIQQNWWFFPIWFSIMFYAGAYSKKFTAWDEVKLLWKVSFFFTLAVLTIIFLGKLTYPISRSFIVLLCILSLGIMPILRISIKRVLIQSGLLKSKVLIVGAGEAGERALQALHRESNLGYEVVGFVDDKASKKQAFVQGIKVHNSLNHVERYIKNCDIQDVVIALTNVDKKMLAQLINQLQLKAKSVLYVPDFAGMAVIGTELRHFFHDQFFAVEINNNLIQPLNYLTKKIFDYAVCLVLSLLLFIPIIIISVLIRITSPGPAIHKQQRIGKNSVPFMCYKFRTMYCDAELRLNKILAGDLDAKKEWETYWKLKNDPRVTPLGNFLRKTSLDELPQIFNVLKGEMSIVGPRPYLPREWGSLKEYSEIIHSVPPGITGLWQVSGRSNSTYEQRLSLDSWYVRNWNLWIDIVILFKTVYVVLKKEGAT
jgi:Undecaprenyl-phosphate galactose phosphotransferase WbaP